MKNLFDLLGVSLIQSKYDVAQKMAKSLLYSGLSISQVTTELKHHGYDINSDDVYSMVMS